MMNLLRAIAIILNTGNIIVQAIMVNETSSRPMISEKNSKSFIKNNQKDDNIHLYIHGNDLSNDKHFYPNLMDRAQQGIELMHPSAQVADLQGDWLTPLFDSDEVLQSSVSTRASLSDSVKNEIFGTINHDFFERSRSSTRPGIISVHKKHMNENNHGSDRLYNIGDLHWSVEQPPFGRVNRKWPILNEPKPDTQNQQFKYYTNKVSRRPNALINPVDYEFGELPVLSGRLLANEPIPQYHHTFKFFEPVPAHFPSIKRIPEFKPVPPQLRIIPVADEYLDRRSNALRYNEYESISNRVNKTERMIGNERRKLLMSSAPFILFKANEAITMPAVQNLIPDTDQSPASASSTTRSYHLYSNMNGRANEQRLKSSGSASKRGATETSILPATLRPYTDPWQNPTGSNNSVRAQNQTSSSPIYYDSVAHSKLLSALAKTEPNEKQQSHKDNKIYTHELGIIGKISNTTHVPEPQQQQQQFNGKIGDLVIRGQMKNVTGTRQQSPRQYRKKDITNTKLTANEMNTSEQDIFRDTPLSLLMEPVSELDKNSMIQPLEAHVPVSASVDSVQLSETYTRQTSNVRARNNGSISVMVKWPNEPNTALEVSDDTDAEDKRGQSRKATTDNPFLIVVYGRNNSDHADSVKTLTDRSAEVAISIDRSDVQANDIGSQDEMKLGKTSDLDWDGGQKTRESATGDLLAQQTTSNQTHPRPKLKIPNKNAVYEAKTAANHRYNDLNANQLLTSSSTTNQPTIRANGSNNVAAAYSIANDHKYHDWFSTYAAKHKESGRKIFSEHFRKVEIKPNVAWAIVPR